MQFAAVPDLEQRGILIKKEKAERLIPPTLSSHSWNPRV
jgi:hypothetical protein